jgi:hypothetical protein
VSLRVGDGVVSFRGIGEVVSLRAAGGPVNA